MKKVFALLIYSFIISTGNCQTADFTWQSTTGLYCTPAAVKFTNRSTGNPIGYAWTFGNNTISNATNPTTTFSTAGTYTVKLIAIFKNKTVSVSKTIVINPAVSAQFSYDRNTMCKDGSIQFIGNPNVPIASYQWNFGDNTGTVSTNLQTISHYFSGYGTFPISYKAIAPTGCSAQSFTAITIKQPIIIASLTPVSGCIPALVSFNANVSDLPPSGTVTSFKWEFGDGSPPITTSTSSISHTYLSAGNYFPRLIITTNEGCTNEYIFEKIAFGTPPVNHIAYSKKLVVCGSESPWFVSKATNANKYFWDFGEGDTTTVTDTTIQHKFKTLGTKTITVTAFYNDCPGNPISMSINVIGVIASFNYSNTCTNKKQFSFNNTTQGNQSTIEWNFGDGISSLQTGNQIHNFPDTGTFNTSISISDNITGCIDLFRTNIYTANPLLVNPDSSICKNTITTFNIPHNYNNPAALYKWDVIGIQSEPNINVPLTINAAMHGHFNKNYVVINNGPQYCPDTINLKNNIIVRGPLLNFTIPAEICLSNPINIINLSIPFISSDTINVWKWNYGINGQNSDKFQPIPYTYPYWGSFEIKLSAIDINGCKDTIVKPVKVHETPFLRSITNVDYICAGQSATLTAFHNDPILWTTALNSLLCNTCDTIIVKPLETTTYYIMATGGFNCNTRDSITIYVHEPFNAESAKNQNYICKNESIELNVSPVNKKVIWSPSTGLSDSTIFNPIASPKQNTTYTANLFDSTGCFSSSTQVNVTVKSIPEVDAGPNKTYPYLTNYTFKPAYSNNVQYYNWEPSVLLNCKNCAEPIGSAALTQNYTVTVISDSGCVSKDNVTIYVECKGANILLPTAFTPNRDNLNDNFYPMTRGIKKIVRFTIYNRQGQLVFDKKDFLPNNKQSGWDGNIQGMPQSPGAYIYAIEAVCEIGETIYSKGSFVLIR